MKTTAEMPNSTDMLTILILQQKLPLEVELIAGELITLLVHFEKWLTSKKKPPYVKVTVEDRDRFLDSTERIYQGIEQAWKIGQETETPDVKAIEGLLTAARDELRALPLAD